jgi:hypothetical protein
MKEHHSHYIQSLLGEKKTLVPLKPIPMRQTRIHTQPDSCAPSYRPKRNPYRPGGVRLWPPTLMVIAAALLHLHIHRQEQPPIAQRAFMSGPFVQHCDLETHPAQIFGQVFASIGAAVQTDDQLIAVNAVGTCKLEEGGETVRK